MILKVISGNELHSLILKLTFREKEPLQIYEHNQKEKKLSKFRITHVDLYFLLVSFYLSNEPFIRSLMLIFTVIV